MRLVNRKRKLSNKEKIRKRAYEREYIQRPYVKRKRKLYRKSEKGRLVQSLASKKYYENNKSSLQKYWKEYRQKNKERIALYMRSRFKRISLNRANEKWMKNKSKFYQPKPCYGVWDDDEIDQNKTKNKRMD